MFSTEVMTAPLRAQDALGELAVQHALLHEQMERCEALADAVDAGGGDLAVLLDEVARLRVAFDAHHQFEEQLLRPMLLRAATGPVRISRIVEHHVEEHRRLWQALHATPTTALRSVLADLREHLENEERQMLPDRGSGSAIR